MTTGVGKSNFGVIPEHLKIGACSISKALDANKCEHDTNTELTVVKAYCVNEEGRFPESNFKAKVPAIVRKEDADTIVLETGSIEITNMVMLTML